MRPECRFATAIALLVLAHLHSAGLAQQVQHPVAAGPEAVGIVPLTGDVRLWFQNGGGSSYWRPDCDTLSNGNAIVLGGMRKAPWADSVPDSENTIDMVAVFSPSGELLEPARTGFFTDAGAPWWNTICTSRNDDKFYGLCADTVGGRAGGRYVLHTIANPDHWPDAFAGHAAERTGEYHTVIQVVADDGTPLGPIINPFGSYASQPGLLRGGTVRFLSNGNIVVNYEDRQSGSARTTLYGARYGRLVGIVILAPDGRVILGPRAISSVSLGNSENRFGLASGTGWFAVRYLDAVTGPTIVGFDNDGVELGRLFPAIDIPELGGDGGNRGDPNGLEAAGDVLYVTHRGRDRKGFLTTIRVGAQGLSVIRTVRFTDWPWSTFEHNADLGVDSAGNVIVMWQDQAWERFQTGRWEMLARLFNRDLDALTPSFCMFEIGNNTDLDEVDPVLGPGRTKQARIAMNDDIIIAIAESNDVPYGDPTSAAEEMFTYTYIARVLRNPCTRDPDQWAVY